MTEGGAGAGPAASLPGRGHPGGLGLGRGPLTWVLARVAGPVVSAQTWLAVIHLMAGVVTGVLAFDVIVALALVGIGTLWLFLIGLPIWWARSGWACSSAGPSGPGSWSCWVCTSVPHRSR